MDEIKKNQIKDNIINIFIIQNKNSLNKITDYLITRKKIIDININNIQLVLKYLIKHKIIIYNNKLYELTKEGEIILNHSKYYYSKIIFKFIKKYYKNKLFRTK
jgi:predicted transcriptional regulator